MFGLFHGANDRWPRWGPRSSPKQVCGLGKPLRQTGSLDPRFDRSSAHSAPSSRHQRAGQLVTGGCRQTATRVIVAHASRAISLFMPTETTRRFDRLKLAEIDITDRLQRFAEERCLASSPARLPARRHTRPAGPRARRWCRASAGTTAMVGWTKVRITGVPAARGGELGVRRPSWVYHPSIDGEGVPLRSVYVTKRRLGGDRIGG